MHYAIHGHTAAEHILERADHQKQNMGLMTWQDAPDGKIKKSDVIIAKNYLSEFELSQLNRMVTSYLDFAENMAQRKIPLTMQDRETRLNGFIEMFEYGLLKDAGKVTAAIAKIHAETEFEIIILGCSSIDFDDEYPATERVQLINGDWVNKEYLKRNAFDFISILIRNARGQVYTILEMELC